MAPVLLSADLPAPAVGAVAAVLALVLIGRGSFRRRLTLSLFDHAPDLAAATMAGTGAAAAGSALGGVVREPRALAVLGGGLLVALTISRAGGMAVQRWGRRRGMLSRRTLIVGCGDMGDRLAGVLTRFPRYGLSLAGFVDDHPLLPVDQRRAPLLGGLRELPALIADEGIDVIVVAFSSDPELAAVDVLRRCNGAAVDILVVPRFYELHASARDGNCLHGVPLVRLAPLPQHRASWPLKRLVDVTAATVGLLVGAPLMAACALAIRLEGGPGVLFRQERIGLGGRPFTLYKFRSLKPVDDAEAATRWNVADDDRLGAVGRLLRRLSIDELPQLWNVLRGDMSLVGPRPERPHFVDRFSLEHEEYPWRHRVPAGLTGWAQVNGLRGNTDIRDRARFDNFYVENWSLWLDLQIVCRTLRELARGA